MAATMGVRVACSFASYSWRIFCSARCAASARSRLILWLNSSSESSTSARRLLPPSADRGSGLIMTSEIGWPAISRYCNAIGTANTLLNSALDDVLIFSLTLQYDLAFRLEFARDGDDLGLSFSHVLAAHRTHGFGIFLHHFDRTRRHVAIEMTAQVLACSLESNHQSLLVDRIHELAQLLLGDFEEIIEGEHQVPDADGELGLLLLDALENLARRKRVEAIHQIGDIPEAGIRALALIANRLQAAIEHSRNLRGYFRRELTYIREASHTIGAHFRLELHQQRGGLLGVEMCEDQSLGLGVLTDEKSGELLGVGLLQQVHAERILVFGTRQSLHHGPGSVLAEGFDQQANCNILSSQSKEVLGSHHLLIFLQNLERYFEGHMTQARDFIGDALQVIFGKIAKNRRSCLVAEQGEQDRRLARAAEGRTIGGAHNGSSRNHACTARVVLTGLCLMSSMVCSFSWEARRASSTVSAEPITR